MGAWEDALRDWGGPQFVSGQLGGFAMDYLCSPPPMPTGVGAIDAETGGMPRGEVTVLAGDAGMGKTALACQLCYASAMRGERPVYVSLEMSRLRCQMRMVACHAALNPHLTADMDERVREVWWSSARPAPGARAMVRDIRAVRPTDPRTGEDATDAELGKLAAAYESGAYGDDPVMRVWRDMGRQVGEAGGMLVADSLATVGGICGLVRDLAGDGAGQLVVIDYAQLVQTGDAEEYDRMATVSRELRMAAKDAGCAVLLISALRKLSGADRKAGPSMDWLKGNNALAYDAGQVLFLLRPDGQEGEPGRVREVELHVAKNRNGASGGRAALSYDAPRNLVRSAVPDDRWPDTTGKWLGTA